MARVLVTGGCGFVGRHLVQALHDRGDEVRVVDLAPPCPGSWAEHRQGSVVDADFLRDAMTGMDRVYHLAGIAHLWTRHRDGFDLANRQGTETVMRVAKELSVSRVVHCSTESILLPKRRPGAPPIQEHSPLTVEDMPGPYTRSKFLAEAAAVQAAQDGLDVTIVNPTVPVGVGDHNMTPPAAMLALFLQGGSSFYLDCVLNLVDVRDAAQGILLAGDNGRTGERYILGGENVELRDLLQRLERMSGRRMPKRRVFPQVALAAGVVYELLANGITKSMPVATIEGVRLALRSAPFDSSKARHELGYAPQPVEAALRAELDWLIRRNNAEQPTSFGHEAPAKLRE